MVACRLCGSREIGLLQKSLGGSRFALRKCRSCRLEFLDPLPAPDDLRRIYTAEYYRSWGMAEGENPAVEAMKKLTFAGHLRRVREHLGGGDLRGDLLDIGTATGLLLEVAREQGFEPYGVEISDYAAGLASAKFGAGRIHNGTLQTAPFGDGRFCVITMTDLLEHVADPLDTLARVRRLLRPDGIVLITTPNTASVTRLAMGRKWTHYTGEIEIHLFGGGFDRPALQELAEFLRVEVAGLTVINHAGELPLADSLRQIARLRELLCVDSALLHLAGMQSPGGGGPQSDLAGPPGLRKECRLNHELAVAL
jgi:SAM-dependent methyltransferase